MREPLVYNSGRALLASGVLKDMPVNVMLTKGYEPMKGHKLSDAQGGEIKCDTYDRRPVANIRLVDSDAEFAVHADDVTWEHLPVDADGAVLYVPGADDALLCFCPLADHKRPLTLRWPNGIIGL